MRDFDEHSKELKEKLRKQDEQIKKVLKAKKIYRETKDIDTYIKFWEDIWANEGLLFESVTRTFELFDLYYKKKDYDKAWGFLDFLITKKPQYLEKIRNMQLKVLKREKKDTSLIESLIEQGK